MIQGWNLYQGWYEKDITGFERILDRLHTQYPDKVLIVTEYGADVDPRLHSFSPEQFDFSQEYGLVYNRHYLEQMRKRPFIAGSSLWNLNAFYSEPRADVVPHVNNKGVTGLDRELKDTYLFFTRPCSTAPPQLVIGNREWRNRSGADDGSGRCTARSGLHQPAVGDPDGQRPQDRHQTSRRGRGDVRRAVRRRREPASWPGPERSPMS